MYSLLTDLAVLIPPLHTPSITTHPSGAEHSHPRTEVCAPPGRPLRAYAHTAAHARIAGTITAITQSQRHDTQISCIVHILVHPTVSTHHGHDHGQRVLLQARDAEAKLERLT